MTLTERKKETQLSMQEKLEQIRKLLAESSDAKEKDEFGYIIPNLEMLTEMMEECEQYDLNIDPDGEAIFCDRVFKCNRVVPTYLLDYCHIKHSFLGGLFVELPCFLLPANKVEEASKDLRKARTVSVVNPTKHGLPSSDVANYATLKYVNPNCYICLAKVPSIVLKDWIFSAKHIDYVYMR